MSALPPVPRQARHGLHGDEQAIMAGHDAGQTVAEIALATGYSAARVANVISRYRYRAPEAEEATIRAASQRLAAACAATGQRFA